MVAIFKAEDQQQISAALDKAKEHTGVEVSLLVVRASDRYLDLIFINAVFVILVVDAILYYSELVTTYGILFGIAVGGICGSILPFVRRYLIGLLPRSVRYHHAARHAVMAFHHARHALSHDAPAVMIYVALAERYVHILHTRSLGAKVPQGLWQQNVDFFIEARKSKSLKDVCLLTIENLAAGLKG